MAVIEAMMVLQVKEIVNNERIVGTVQRFGPTVHPRKSVMSCIAVEGSDVVRGDMHALRRLSA